MKKEKKEFLPFGDKKWLDRNTGGGSLRVVKRGWGRIRYRRPPKEIEDAIAHTTGIVPRETLVEEEEPFSLLPPTDIEIFDEEIARQCGKYSRREEFVFCRNRKGECNMCSLYTVIKNRMKAKQEREDRYASIRGSSEPKRYRRLKEHRR